MKTRNIVLAVLVCLVILVLFGYGYGNSRKNSRRIQEIIAEKDRVSVELKKAYDEIKALTSDLNILKLGSTNNAGLKKLNDEIEALKVDLSVLKLTGRTDIEKIREMVAEQIRLYAAKDKTAHFAGSGQDKTTPNIAVVDIRSLFQNCSKSVEHREKTASEENRILAELEKLNREVEALKADLNTRKFGSSDYMAIMREVLEKQSQLASKKEFNERQMALQDQLWVEQFFKEILQSVETVAKKKGIDLVFAKDSLDLPAPSGRELMLAVRTHKLLYGADALDITEEVLSCLEENGNQQKANLKNE